MTKVILLKPYGPHSKGAVLELPQKDIADSLVRRGIAKLPDKPKPKPKLQEWVKKTDD